jgi:hypothetical protein
VLIEAAAVDEYLAITGERELDESRFTVTTDTPLGNTGRTARALVEHPARMQLGTTTAARQWAPSRKTGWTRSRPSSSMCEETA